METLKQAVQEAVNSIYQEHGEVRPSVLVEYAKPKDSPAHDAFEWDNKKAGNEYRLIQARQWIRRVEIIVEDRPERLVHVPRVVVEGESQGATHETDGNESYYKPISVVSQDDDEYKRALSETLARLNTCKEVYRQLKVAATKVNVARKPKFDEADRGFEMVQTALTA